MSATISLSVLLLTAAVIGVRALLLNTTHADRAFNLAVSLLIGVAALRDHTVQRSLSAVTRRLLTPALLNNISGATVTLSAAAFLLLGLAWLDTTPSPRLRTAVWLTAIVSVVSVQLIVHSSDPAPAAAHGLHTGWAIAAYSGGMPVAFAAIIAHDALSYSFCVLLLVIGAREIRTRPRGLELLVCSWAIVLALGWLLQTLSVSIATLVAATGRYYIFLSHYAALESISPLFDSAGMALLAAIPLVRFGAEYVREELYSRILNHRLNLLWAALTAVCPEIVQSVPNHKALAHPRYQLHLRVIEIRDAVMILSRYVTNDMISYSQQCTDVPALQQAIQLQMATGAKLRGETAQTALRPAQVASTAGLIDDAVELLELARSWSTALRLGAAESRLEPIPPVAAERAMPASIWSWP